MELFPTVDTYSNQDHIEENREETAKINNKLDLIQEAQMELI